MTAMGALLAGVWIASCLLVWNIEPAGGFGLVPTADFFFRFVPMVVAIGALFGRTFFGVVVGIGTAFTLIGIEMVSVLMLGA